MLPPLLAVQVSVIQQPVAGRSGNAYVQISSNRDQAEAAGAFRSLQAAYPNVLGDQQAFVRRADLGSKGTFYRTQIGPFSAGQADRLCNNLKAAGGQCFLQFD